MSNPNFNKNMTINEFKSYYWYREDLVNICRKLDLDYDGSKDELEKRIIAYLNGNILESKRKNLNKKRMNKKMTDVTAEMKIIEGGFKFNNAARDFFKTYFNTDKFTFNREMVLAVREAEENNDLNMTVQDLIDIYTKKKNINKELLNSSKQTCQWNNFYKDLCHDSRCDIFNKKMKVASILWKIVKQSNKTKEYSYDLIEDNYDLIKDYIK